MERLGLVPEKQRQAVELLISFFMQWCLAACSLALVYQLLLLLHFTRPAAMAGALSLLFATSYLAYVQSAQENSLLLLTGLAALYSVVRSAGSGGELRWAPAAGAACGFAILTRLPSLLDAGVFFVLALAIGCPPGRFLKGYAPPVAAALFIDRWYQWRRFGDVFHTYMYELGRQLRPPGAPLSFPFSYPFSKGFLGTLFSPDKSIFLFDPLLVVLIAVAAWKWRQIDRLVRTLLLGPGGAATSLHRRLCPLFRLRRRCRLGTSLRRRSRGTAGDVRGSPAVHL